MQRKPGFPVANCNIKMPDCPANMEHMTPEDDSDHQQRRQQLINFGHAQWGFNNWNWSVTKQELDFVDYANGKYCAGVVAFVSITVKSSDIHRENIGYATSVSNTKGMAIYKSRKGAVTNALRETLLSFGGSVAADLTELGEGGRAELEVTETPAAPSPALGPAYRPPEPRNSPTNKRKEVIDSGCANTRVPVVQPASKPHALPVAPPAVPPVAPPAVAARAAPVARPPPPPPLRPNSNEAPKTGLEDMSEEEARAERKRRQRLAQEEFRLKLNMKQNHDENQDVSKGSGIDEMLMDLPTQDIVIEDTAATTAGGGKRKSPVPNNPPKRRGSVLSKLDIVQN